MKKAFLLVLLGLCLFVSGACGTTVTSIVGGGLLVSYVSVPTDHPKQSSTTEVGERSGEACSHSVLTLFAWGDASLKAAAENGEITNVLTVDTKTMTILPFGLLYAQSCTVVSGN